MKDAYMKVQRSRSLYYSLIFSVLAHALALQSSLNFQGRVKNKKKLQVILEKSNDRSRQIVDTEDSLESVPTKESFLGQKNNFFKKQMRAKVTGSFQRNEQKDKVKIKNKIQPKIFLSDLGFDYHLKSSTKSSHRKTISQNNNFLEEIPLGDLTVLNTSQFKFFGFYHRIRKKLEQYWGSTLRRRARKIMHVTHKKNHITSLSVTLDEQGKILQIKIKGSSGVKDFDQAAIEAFNRAGPFFNPPREMLKDGKVVIEWGFVVKS